VDVYDTIVSCDFTRVRDEMSALAGITPEAWHDAYQRISPSLTDGRISKAEGFGEILRAYGQEPRPGLIREMVKRDQELLLENAHLYDDAIPFLDRLRVRGVKIAIVSNCAETTRPLLVQLGVDALADALILSCEVRAAKPAAEIFLAALNRLEVTADAAVFVDDQARFCAGAVAVGIDAVQIVRGEPDGRGPAAGTRVVRSLTEVEDMFWSGPGDAPRVRLAGRVIVLDPDDRVLLFRYDEGSPTRSHWCTPGGGLNDGEDYATGAQRELTEETGWSDVPLGREVGQRTRTIQWSDGAVRQDERFFLARVGDARRELGDVAAMHSSDGIAAWHWWTLAELDSTTEVIWPQGLADLVRGLLGLRWEAARTGQPLNWQGRRLMPLTKLDSSRSGSPAVMSGTRVSSSRSMTVSSRRARCAPRQKCGPAAPKPTCGFGARVMSNRSGSANTASSRFAE
jgi:HAD superfamily hydrolase (TIGR01509 family)